MNWEKHDHRAPHRLDPPAPVLIETCWRVLIAHTGRIVRCALYRDAYDRLEIRCSYSNLELIRSQVVPDPQTGRARAAAWLDAVRAMGSCEELPQLPL